MTSMDELRLVSEFAAVSVAVLEIAGRPMLRITELSSARATQLDPDEALSLLCPKGSEPGARSGRLQIELDLVANGPRLKIRRLSDGAAAYLDPLQLSDAALSGSWEKSPPAYDC